ncbi:MAG: nitroreductase family protein [Propionibacteriales bacterium]|nr:nitroreductase family protein [Propionibacteriales bacterium]
MASEERPEIDPLLRNRWSTRLFDPTHELADAELGRLLEAARWSPSAGNSQPWAFLVARRGDAAHQTFVTTLSRGNVSWVPQASAVLVSLYRAGDDEDPALTFSDYAQYDLGQSVAHLTVQAESMGLAVHQFAGFNHDDVASMFSVPPAFKVTTGIAIGRWADPAVIAADEGLVEREQRPRVRKEIGEFVFAGEFGVPIELA